MSKNLIARLAVAIVFIPIILWICYEGGWQLYGFVMFLAAMAMSEFLVAEGYSLKRPAFWLVLLFTGYLVSLNSGIKCPYDVFSAEGEPIILIGLFLVMSMLFAIGKEEPAKLFGRLTRLTWGMFYIGLLYPFVYKLSEIGLASSSTIETFMRDVGIDKSPSIEGGDALLFLFAILWIGDTAAMYVGKTFGKHKLAPSVSPNKTVEGFIGGLVASLIVGIVMSYWKFTEFPIYQILILAVICSLFGQLGDLVESMWKRSLKIKDSSAIIPGHGGFLDRFDSLLFAAPVMYYYFIIFR